jgi:hypothetical protein
VRLIDTIGTPTMLGCCYHDLGGGGREEAVKRMFITLAGPLESEPWENIPKWPLRHERTTDERHLAELAHYLGLEEREYDRVVHEAIKITLTDRYRHLHAAVTGVLDFQPQIGPICSTGSNSSSGALGGFKWSSQHLDREELRWVDREGGRLS